MLNKLFLILVFGLVVVIMGMLYRIFKGPSIYDRLNGFMVLGTNTILLIVLFGYINGRPEMFVDIAIAYAILGFISFVVVAKFLGGKGPRHLQFLGAILLILGFMYILIAALGVLRFPDFYSRLHASGGCETLGMFLSITGLIIIEGFSATGLKLLLIVIFILLANPIGTHTLSRAAFRGGLKPWTKKGD